MHFKVAAVNCTDYFVFRDNGSGYKEGVGGFEFEFLRTLSKAMKFSYEIVSPADGTWGTKNEDGTWTGMIGMLQNQEADLALEQIALSYERSKDVDFTTPYLYDQLTFSMKSPGFKTKQWLLFDPYDMKVWVAVIISILSCSVFMAILRTKKRRFPFWKECLMGFEILIGRKNTNALDKGAAIRIFLALILLMMMVLSICYNAIFFATMMAPIRNPRIDSIEGLISASKRGQERITTYADTGSWFQGNLDDTKTALQREIMKQKKYFLGYDGTEHLRILEGFAVLNNGVLQMVSLNKAGVSEGDIFISSDSLHTIYVSIFFRKGFCCKTRFDETVLRFLSGGIYQKVFSDYLFHLKLKTKQSPQSQRIRPIAISDLISLFYITLPMFVFSLLFFIAERLLYFRKHKRINRKKRKLPLHVKRNAIRHEQATISC